MNKKMYMRDEKLMCNDEWAGEKHNLYNTSFFHRFSLSVAQVGSCSIYFTQHLYE